MNYYYLLTKKMIIIRCYIKTIILVIYINKNIYIIFNFIYLQLIVTMMVLLIFRYKFLKLMLLTTNYSFCCKCMVI